MLVSFNKPYQVLSQFTDSSGRATLSDYIDIKNIYSIGRLDYDSEGLMLLTDDGRLKHNLSNPDKKINKVYLVQVEGIVKNPHVDLLSKGIKLKDGNAKAISTRILFKQPVFVWKRTPSIRQRKNSPTSWLEVTINEGRNRQVRRMMAHVGLPVLRLIRIQIGHYKLNQLSIGEYKILDA